MKKNKIFKSPVVLEEVVLQVEAGDKFFWKIFSFPNHRYLGEPILWQKMQSLYHIRALGDQDSHRKKRRNFLK